MEMRKQVMSFNEFINEAYRIISEAEGENIGSLDSLKKLFGGGLGLSKVDQDKFNKIIDRFDNLNPSKGLAEDLEEDAETITTALNNKAEGVNIKQRGVTNDVAVGKKYKWLVNGTCRVKGSPTAALDYNDGSFGYNKYLADEETITEPISDLLKKLFNQNMLVLRELATEGKKALKKDSNFGTKGKAKGKIYQFRTIDEESLDTDIIQILNYNEETVPSANPSGEYGFAFPIYTIDKVDEFGEELSVDIYEEVLPPNPLESTEEVENLPYNSSGVDFFAENDVVIGDDGMAALRAILSEFNSISKIVVNGGASSKPTKRAGGNEKLAQDRMNAGVTALTQMKKDGVEQLKSAVIEKGKAAVQSGAASESDPKNQQVSFVISGSIRKMSAKPNNEPQVIQKVDVKKAQRVTFKKNFIYCSFDIA
jgi:hypothetical protein